MRPPTKFQRRVFKLEKLMRNASAKMQCIEPLNEYQVNGLAQFCGEIAFGDQHLTTEEQEAVNRIADRYTADKIWKHKEA